MPTQPKIEKIINGITQEVNIQITYPKDTVDFFGNPVTLVDRIEILKPTVIKDNLTNAQSISDAVDVLIKP